MKCYFFSQIYTDNLGPLKKIKSQVKVLNQNGIITNLVIAKRANIPLTTVRKIIARLPFTSVVPIHLYKNEYRQADVYYIRFTNADLPFLIFLVKLRNKNKDSKIILEFPDYPYSMYFKKWHQKTIELKDFFYRRYLHRYVDIAVTFGNHNEIYSIPTIKTINGIIVDEVEKRFPSSLSSDIHLICVSGMMIFHGIDRLLLGMKIFYESEIKRKVFLHLVGDGPEKIKYEEIVHKYNFSDKVFFYGKRTGKELDEIYNRCQLGVASLGLHRFGMNIGSFLKTREYLAKGLPMITGCKIDVFENSDYPYYLEFPSDESPIDIEKVVAFYDQVYMKSGKMQDEIIKEIRDFAYCTCDMSVTMKPIIDYIKSSARKQGVAEYEGRTYRKD